MEKLPFTVAFQGSCRPALPSAFNFGEAQYEEDDEFHFAPVSQRTSSSATASARKDLPGDRTWSQHLANEFAKQAVAVQSLLTTHRERLIPQVQSVLDFRLTKAVDDLAARNTANIQSLVPEIIASDVQRILTGQRHVADKLDRILERMEHSPRPSVSLQLQAPGNQSAQPSFTKVASLRSRSFNSSRAVLERLTSDDSIVFCTPPLDNDFAARDTRQDKVVANPRSRGLKTIHSGHVDSGKNTQGAIPATKLGATASQTRSAEQSDDDDCEHVVKKVTFKDPPVRDSTNTGMSMPSTYQARATVAASSRRTWTKPIRAVASEPTAAVASIGESIAEENVADFDAFQDTYPRRSVLPECLIPEAWESDTVGPLYIAMRWLPVIFATLCTGFLGVRVTISMQCAKNHCEEPISLYLVDMLLAVGFLLEVLFRMRLSSQVFRGPDKMWDVLDAFIACVSILDSILSLFGLLVLDCFLGYLWPFRVLHTLRLVRVFRVFRFTSRLRLMLSAILSSIREVLWAGVVLLVVLYMFAVVIMYGVSMFFRWTGIPSDAGEIEALYGDLPRTLLTLFMAVSSGMDWEEAVIPLRQLSQAWCVLFVAFVMIVGLGVLNILAAIFVGTTLEASQLDRELAIQEDMRRDRRAARDLRSIFKKDADGDAMLSQPELEEQLKQEATLAGLRTLGLEISQARGLFRLLDVDEQGSVGIDELVNGLMRLKGNAKAVDLATLLYENKRIMVRLSACMHFVEDNFNEVHECLAMLGEYLQSSSAGRSHTLLGKHHRSMNEYVCTQTDRYDDDARGDY